MWYLFSEKVVKEKLVEGIEVEQRVLRGRAPLFFVVPTRSSIIGYAIGMKRSLCFNGAIDNS